MTYLQFHLVFLLPPLLLLSFPAHRASFELGTRGRWAAWAVPPIALLYTTLWDNYLVWKEIWWYGPDRVLAVIGYVPVEEYAFFVLQPLMTGFIFYTLLVRAVRDRRIDAAPTPPNLRSVGGWIGMGAIGLGAGLLTAESGTYMGLILVWAVPVLLAMWLYMGPAVWRARRTVVTAVALSTVYLWIADRIAIGLGVWEISDRYTLGFDPLGLPIEEATFFLLTNLVCVFGLVLFLAPGLEPLRGRSSA